MSQTKEGSIKAKETMYAKYGKDYFKNIGKSGGKKKNPLKGFGSNRDLASTAGKLGGKISRRSAAK